MGKQMTLMGKTKERIRKEKGMKKELKFMKKERLRLIEKMDKIKNGEFSEKWKSEWWYCNNMKDLPKPSEENALERLNYFIDDYKNMIKKREDELD